MEKINRMVKEMRNSNWYLNTTRVKGYRVVSIIIYFVIIYYLGATYNTSLTKIISLGIILYALIENAVIQSLLNTYNTVSRSDESNLEEEDSEPLENREITNHHSVNTHTTSKLRSLSEYKDNILTLRKSGSSYQSIATKYGVSRTTMTKFIKSLG